MPDGMTPGTCSRRTPRRRHAAAPAPSPDKAVAGAFCLGTGGILPQLWWLLLWWSWPPWSSLPPWSVALWSLPLWSLLQSWSLVQELSWSALVLW